MDRNKLSSKQLDFQERLNSLLAWENISNNKVTKTVNDIISTIKNKGDRALVEYSIKFDGVKARSMADLTLQQSELKKAFETLESKEKKALITAAQRIKNYHQKQQPKVLFLFPLHFLALLPAYLPL